MVGRDQSPSVATSLGRKLGLRYVVPKCQLVLLERLELSWYALRVFGAMPIRGILAVIPMVPPRFQ